MEDSILIHNVLKGVDWDSVFFVIKKMELNKSITSTVDAIKELQIVLEKVLEEGRESYIANYWRITLLKDDQGKLLEVVFAPITVFADTDLDNSNLLRKYERDLKLALEQEDYIAAAKLRENIEKVRK